MQQPSPQSQCCFAARPFPLGVAQDVIATQVSASADYTCAVTLRDTVVCWGALPSRTIGHQSWAGVAQVSAGVVAICAVTRDGALLCTGACEHVLRAAAA